MKASHFSEDVQEFLRLLFDHKVEYVIVGGEAVIYHGHARLTGDVDIFYRQEASNATRLFEALSVFWENDIPEVDTVQDLLAPGLILQFGVPPNRLDLLGSISGVSFEEAWESRIEETIQVDDRDCSVFYIGKDMLIRNKQASGRGKDQDDIRYLEE